MAWSVFITPAVGESMIAKEVTETDYGNRTDDVIANDPRRKMKDPYISWLEWLVDHRT
jgi:hypothetical protein